MIFHNKDFVRIELRLPWVAGDEPPMEWWDRQEWISQHGLLSLSNRLAEYDEMRPLPPEVTDFVWWDHFDGTDRWSWYFPEAKKDLATLFKLTWAGRDE